MQVFANLTVSELMMESDCRDQTLFYMCFFPRAH